LIKSYSDRAGIYHLRANEFLDSVGKIEQSCVPLQNFPALIRWNRDKRYLRQLGGGGRLDSSYRLVTGIARSLPEVCSSYIIDPACISDKANILWNKYEEEPAHRFPFF
jgi:hypothetical protein